MFKTWTDIIANDPAVRDFVIAEMERKRREAEQRQQEELYLPLYYPPRAPEKERKDHYEF